MIKLTQLNKVYHTDAVPVHALRDINLTIAQGELTAIVGASGSGKSTLMNVLGFMDRWTSGTYKFNSSVISRDASETQLAQLRAQNIGFVFQQFNLMPRLTVLENVLLPTRFYRKFNDSKVRGLELLHQVGLSHKCDKLPNNLSGGEKQRVAIARALINDPAIVFADEPTGALDATNTFKILELFKQLNQAGQTIIIITHDSKVANVCTRQIQISDGSII
jgi:putative ABC transport system ATP-binding protein